MRLLKAKIVDGGRLILPVEIRRAMQLNKGDSVLLELDDDELRIRSARSAIKRIQDKYRAKPGEPLLSDTLIEERRREAAREESH